MVNPLAELNDQQDQVDSTSELSGTGFASVAPKITVWTSNLLATAVVIIIAITVGTPLISSFRWEEKSDLTEAMNTDLAYGWQTLESCALEFGNAPFQLLRESAQCQRTQVISLLHAKCKEALEQNVLPVGEISSKESKAIQNLVNHSKASPIEQNEGRWRIFHIETTDDRLNLPLVVGVRDDIVSPGDSVSDDKTVTSSSRLVVWGLAMPGKSGLASDTTATTGNPDEKDSGNRKADQETQSWTTFVAHSVPETEADLLKRRLVPTTFDRTLAIANNSRTSMIGFHGKGRARAIAFYDDLAENGLWTTTKLWQQTGDTWSAQFKLPKESPLQGIQVQLQVNHNEDVRGMLIVQQKIDL